jgi:hypothetical protein
MAMIIMQKMPDFVPSTKRISLKFCRLQKKTLHVRKENGRREKRREDATHQTGTTPD